MRAFISRKKLYFCESCEEFYDMSDLNVTTAYYCTGEITDNYYECADLEEVWYCGNGCFHHDESPPSSADYDAWECGECGSVYVDQDVAISCCT